MVGWCAVNIKIDSYFWPADSPYSVYFLLIADLVECGILLLPYLSSCLCPF